MAKHNLSQDGFVEVVTLGIDYAHQAICMDQVAPRLQQAVEARLHADYGDQLVSVLAAFNEAATSSLNYVIGATMRPGAAEDYYAILRTIQQTCVQVCNTRGWRIPFPQLVIHGGEGLQVPGAKA